MNLRECVSSASCEKSMSCARRRRRSRSARRRRGPGGTRCRRARTPCERRRAVGDPAGHVEGHGLAVALTVHAVGHDRAGLERRTGGGRPRLARQRRSARLVVGEVARRAVVVERVLHVEQDRSVAARARRAGRRGRSRSRGTRRCGCAACGRARCWRSGSGSGRPRAGTAARLVAIVVPAGKFMHEDMSTTSKPSRLRSSPPPVGLVRRGRRSRRR